jgi:hypothetical protein
MTWVAIEEIVEGGYVQYAIGQTVPDDVAAEYPASCVEDPPAPVPVATKPIQVHDTATGLIVGDTVDGREKLKDGDAA